MANQLYVLMSRENDYHTPSVVEGVFSDFPTMKAYIRQSFITENVDLTHKEPIGAHQPNKREFKEKLFHRDIRQDRRSRSEQLPYNLWYIVAELNQPLGDQIETF